MFIHFKYNNSIIFKSILFIYPTPSNEGQGAMLPLFGKEIP